jgi:hypothetical protein
MMSLSAVRKKDFGRNSAARIKTARQAATAADQSLAKRRTKQSSQPF